MKESVVLLSEKARPMPTAGPDVICFAGQDWWYHNRAHSDFQLFTRIARSRRHEFESALPELPHEEPFLSPLREAIAVESQRLREIEARREGLILRSPIEGQVGQIFCRHNVVSVPLHCAPRGILEPFEWLLSAL